MLDKIFTHVLYSLYQPFWAAVLFSALVLTIRICVMKLKKEDESNLRYIVNLLFCEIKRDKENLIRLLWYFYIAMILFRTLVNRNLWENPLSNVLGVWGIYRNGELTTEVIENLILFIPYAFLREAIIKRNGVNRYKFILTEVAHVLKISLSIEILQLLLRVGTFELSDIFYNALGGFIGSTSYLIVDILQRRKKKNG